MSEARGKTRQENICCLSWQPRLNQRRCLRFRVTSHAGSGQAQSQGRSYGQTQAQDQDQALAHPRVKSLAHDQGVS
jgi:hypothetical protein